VVHRELPGDERRENRPRPSNTERHPPIYEPYHLEVASTAELA
jgi:hypothetical protein